MPVNEKLPRVTQKIFASSDDAKIGQFGSALAGTKAETGDIAQIQELPAWLTGWAAAVISNQNYPTLEEMDGVQKVFSQQIAYILQNGIPEYDANTVYFKNSICQYDGILYQSLIDDNVGNQPDTSPNAWKNLQLNAADIDLSNLTALGDQKLAISRIYDTGISSDAEAYQKIYNLKHGNGAKEGIDVIKPDNYTIVGLPTITDDGIITASTNNDYVRKDNINLTDNFTFTIVIDVKDITANITGIFGLYFNNSCYIKSFFTLSSSTVGINNEIRFDANSPIYRNALGSIGTLKRIKIVHKYDFATKTLTTEYYNADTNALLGDSLYTNDNAAFDRLVRIDLGTIGYGRNNNDNYNIDLNLVEINVNDNVIYQPMLSIPYTQAVTGAKIVDKRYWDRVEDWYNQSGEGNYLMIDEENQQSSLALPDIYGLIEQSKLKQGNNVKIENGVISTKDTVNYNNTNGGIIEAPNGVLQVLGNGTQLKIPQGLKVALNDGRNGDNTLNNFDFVVSSDITANLPNTLNGSIIAFLSVSADRQTATLSYRPLSQFFEQSELPILTTNEGTWYNNASNLWYNITTQTNQWQKGYYCKLAQLDVVNGVVQSQKIYQPLRTLTYADRITNLNQTDYSKGQNLTYNTVFTASQDGMLFISSAINVASSNSFSDRNSFAEVRGLIGNNVSVQNVTSGQDVTKTLSEEYTNAGTYTVNIPVDGYYNVTLVGGGGTGTNALYANGLVAHASGGSGAAFSGELYLTAGEHSITVGGYNGNTIIDGITAGAGGQGAIGLGTVTAGAGGALSVTGTTRNIALQSNGNAGSTNVLNVPQAGGASVYNGWGQGGASNGSPAAGYFKIYGTYTESSATTEIVTTGTLIYQHDIGITWDGTTNTVTSAITQSAVIPIFKGEQFILYTNRQQNNPTIDADIVFYPSKLNTGVSI